MSFSRIPVGSSFAVNWYMLVDIDVYKIRSFFPRTGKAMLLLILLWHQNLLSSLHGSPSFPSFLPVNSVST